MNRFIELVDRAIDIDSLRNKIDDPDVGAHGWFYGVTRRTTQHLCGQKITSALAYEAHRPMAQRQLELLAEQAAQKFHLAHVVIVHRLGEVADWRSQRCRWLQQRSSPSGLRGAQLDHGFAQT